MEVREKQFVEFRNELYETFNKRADATMDLIDAISGNQTATSPVQLSLSPLFRRQYASIHDAVDNFYVSKTAKYRRTEQQQKIMRVTSSLIPEPGTRNFYLFGADATSQPRQFAKTLKDRSFVYRPNPIKGNKPVTIGHSYSALVGMPEKAGDMAPPWVIPISLLRIPTAEKSTDIAASQIDALLCDTHLPFGEALNVVTGDTAYSAVTFLSKVSAHSCQVAVVRVRGNRVFYRLPVSDSSFGGKGHPIWFGTKSALGDSETYGTPDETVSVIFTTGRGRNCNINITAWRDLLMRGKKNIPMHKRPFTVLRITVEDKDGNPIFRKPMWLIIYGKRRDEIAIKDAYDAYRQRFDPEHFFRFRKTEPLLDSYKTSVTEHEENWWEIVGLAYALLFAASGIAEKSCCPWERYLPYFKRDTGIMTPSTVQRDMPRIIAEFGTPAKAPEPRGKSPGRLKGERPVRREPFPVIKKAVRRQKKVAQGP